MNGSQNHISLVVYLDATSVKSHGQEDDLQYGHAVSSKMGPICQYMWANFLLSALRVFLECGPFGWVAYSLVVCRSMASDSAVQTAVAWFFFGMVGFFLVTEAFMSLMSLRILRSVQQWRPGTKSEPVSEVVACLDMAYVPLVSTMVLNCLMLVFYLMLECNGSGWKDLSEGLSCPSVNTPEAKIRRFMTLWMGLTAAMIYTGCCVWYKTFRLNKDLKTKISQTERNMYTDTVDQTPPPPDSERKQDGSM